MFPSSLLQSRVLARPVARSLASSTESSSVMAFTFSSIDFISPRTEAAARTDEEEGRGGGGEAMSGACAGVTDARFNRCLLNH